MPHTSWRTLRDPIMADPERRTRIEEMGRASGLVIALANMLDTGCDPQGAADVLTSPPSGQALTIGDAESLFLVILTDGIEALGGRLEVKAVFPGRTIDLVSHRPAQSE